MPPNNDGPDNTIVVIADDGTIYKLDEAYWKAGQQITNPGAVGALKQLKQFGSVVASLDKNIAVGFGTCCTVLNLGELKRG